MQDGGPIYGMIGVEGAEFGQDWFFCTHSSHFSFFFVYPLWCILPTSLSPPPQTIQLLVSEALEVQTAGEHPSSGVAEPITIDNDMLQLEDRLPLSTARINVGEGVVYW